MEIAWIKQKCENLPMGEFIAMSTVVGKDLAAVESAAQGFAALHGGSFVPASIQSADSSLAIAAQSPVGTSLLFPDGFMLWDEFSQHVSSVLCCPVFSLHIHDGDIWLFTLFSNGVETTRFNPVPDYWCDVSEEERASWAGNAAAIASAVPGLSVATIERYFVNWTVEQAGLAYADDRVPYGNCWQMLDFLRRLGFEYPVSGSGDPIGPMYQLELGA